ncbi:DUF6520 family protein [Chitinophaga niabensis]|uniref:NVEALA protein n=1 Tax=Chitinophaga niabensis TaxID=536979 RepID=A0A1N6KAM0_9BACT|nr:DUF6520 family protein [Chitinophaga niabensis]SIO53598.1 hypothetical protein SAMN04488055_5444 [Chitinophaga niabensis]
MKKKLFLAAAAFMLAIGGAFASQLLLPEPGFSKKADVSIPTGVQQDLCEVREECDGGTFACTADFQEGAIIYTNVQLYGLSNPADVTTCTVALTRSIP